jgi:capsular polysaccharide biosynthesis protein
MNKYTLSIIVFNFLAFTLQAQNTSGYDQALVATNKMIAVILVLLVILFGIAFFLVYLDKKIKKLEDQIKP